MQIRRRPHALTTAQKSQSGEACHSQLENDKAKTALDKISVPFYKRLIFLKILWGGRWDSNPRRQESQSWTLPTELRPPLQEPIHRGTLHAGENNHQRRPELYAGISHFASGGTQKNSDPATGFTRHALLPCDRARPGGRSTWRAPRQICANRQWPVFDDPTTRGANLSRQVGRDKARAYAA